MGSEENGSKERNESRLESQSNRGKSLAHDDKLQRTRISLWVVKKMDPRSGMSGGLKARVIEGNLWLTIFRGNLWREE